MNRPATADSASKIEILDAAAQCFMELGAGVATIDDVASRLGATKGRIYHHFASKDVLVGSVRLRTPLLVQQSVKPVKDMTLPPDQTIERMAQMHVRTVLDNIAYFKVYVATMSGATSKTQSQVKLDMQEQVLRATNAYENLYREVLEIGMDQGLFRRRHISVTLHNMLVLLNAPIFWLTPERPTSAEFIDQVVENTVDMGLSSLR